MYTNNFKFSFDDEPIIHSCYDLINKRIELKVNSYYDIDNDNYVEKSAVFIIEDWYECKCFVGQYEKWVRLEEKLGILSMILYMKHINQDVEMLIVTIDNRYITICFTSPTLRLL